ncbi:MAG: DUF971 domain-containing protein [Planctomycetota bacterium]|nr:DUF971 domain-containing protein [Planctomycetota bacterium]MDP6988198.1 DUF971 domain-containing protein [Planctomycetota bacterium]
MQPRVITGSDPSRVRIEWSDGHVTTYLPSQLRGLCPCAGCVNEVTGVRTHDPAGVPEDLTQTNLRLVGHYALTLRFSDGHDTGIFPFDALRRDDPGRS